MSKKSEWEVKSHYVDDGYSRRRKTPFEKFSNRAVRLLIFNLILVGLISLMFVVFMFLTDEWSIPEVELPNVPTETLNNIFFPSLLGTFIIIFITTRMGIRAVKLAVCHNNDEYTFKLVILRIIHTLVYLAYLLFILFLAFMYFLVRRSVNDAFGWVTITVYK